MKRHAPAALRNREAIAKVLAKELPASGTVLEVASGSGEHAVYFAEAFASLKWQPSDPDPEAVASIVAYRDEAGLGNLQPPVTLDAGAETWPVAKADAILCINMIHISPLRASKGLFAGAERLLEKAVPLVLYGPYFEEGVQTAPSNLDFDASLKARHPEWGIRQIEWVDRLAEEHGFTRTQRYEMPANNLTLVYCRV